MNLGEDGGEVRRLPYMLLNCDISANNIAE